MKNITISLQVKTIYRGDKAFQYFVVVEESKAKYVFNKIYTMSELFEDFVKSNALSTLNEDFVFVSRRDEADRVVLEFSYPQDKHIHKVGTYYYVLYGDIPFSNGCEDCAFKKSDTGDLFYCDKKEKTMDKKMKTCKFFKQKRGDTRELC